MSRKKKDSITLSPKHGLNPSITYCQCCGKEIGIALFGKLKNDEEAPKEVAYGLCDDCQKVIDVGGVLVIEVRDGESGPNPYRTGRIIGCSKEFKERFEIDNPIVYMEKSIFTELFGEQFNEDKPTEEGDNQTV